MLISPGSGNPIHSLAKRLTGSAPAFSGENLFFQ